tara:strand:- start:1234 stop:2262 length:1029 start_codon:yes stop_codon:yes gene_type:complete
MIDLRSDTVTKPTEKMKESIMKAKVGDDVFGEDPTVNELQKQMAENLGKEDALFVPSGTMANQLGIGSLTQPGDELLCHSSYHVFQWEGGGLARLWGVTTRTIEKEEGFLDVEDLQNKVRPLDSHYAKTSIISLENTLNRMGGRVYPLDKIKKIAFWARNNGLKMHLDGARLFNASIASDIPLKEWGKYFDTISVCFSKGLGAPLGSILVGSKVEIEKAHRLRKVMGGGMRQAGVAAAAALYAINNNVERLKIDHANARILANSIMEIDGLDLEFSKIETNIVWIKVDPKKAKAPELIKSLKDKGILVTGGPDNLIRAVTHLDVDENDIQKVSSTLLDLMKP